MPMLLGERDQIGKQGQPVPQSAAPVADKQQLALSGPGRRWPAQTGLAVLAVQALDITPAK